MSKKNAETLYSCQTDRPDTKQRLKEIVELLLPDSLMIGLALVMVPVILIPLLVELPETVDRFFSFVDFLILAMFILEYVAKTVLAPNILKHVLNPWHLLDLFIILVPFVSLTTSAFGGLGHSSLLLRLLRITRLLAIGGRTVDRKAEIAPPAKETSERARPPLEVQLIDGHLQNRHEHVPMHELKNYLNSPTQTWVHISAVGEEDFTLLSDVLGIPRILLESELIDEYYPRVDYFEHYAMIFARVADIQASNESERFCISRAGLLAICWKQNVITISKVQTGLFDVILERARKIHAPDEPLVVSILYTILKYVLEKDKQIIIELEKELMVLEGIPLSRRMPKFLENTFLLRKEVNQLVPGLLHLKEIIAMITSKRLPLEGFSDRHAYIFNILHDEAKYLHETASNARDNLQSLIDLYINTTSFETNRVMRVIAVITSLGIIPATLGILGSNIVGNPWDIQLWQLFAVLGMMMLGMMWAFGRLGWLKG